MRYWLGVDTGGTFSDFVLWRDGEVRIHKVLSTPHAPELAILRGIRELGLEQSLHDGRLAVVHGTTVATNAALEGKGVPTLFVTNRGLEDLLRLRRQTRPALYDLTPARPQDPAAESASFGIGGRLDASGREIEPLTEADLESLIARVRESRPRAVAISLLFGFLNPEHERRIEAALADSGCFVCRASALLPLAGEYERGIATWLNAWLGPVVAEYLLRLEKALGRASLSIMQSHGGTAEVRQAAAMPVNLLLSGPAGGLAAAHAVAEEVMEPKVMTFDMGGTSTDVALIDGEVRLTAEGRLGPWPVAVPMVEMHTIGAGGGSLARVDEAGMLHVGPQSAGADPGPACYGRGGQLVTVTDANLMAGRLPATLPLAGSLQLDRGAAERAFLVLADELGVTVDAAVAGVLALANEHMAQALRVISIQKGYDPADFALVSFGGAGGLHACDLAEMLGMSRVIVPLNSGVLSAQGLLQAPPCRELVQTLPPAAGVQEIEHLRTVLAATAKTALRAEGIGEDQLREQVYLELCYEGQSFHLPVPWTGDLEQAEAAFHALHRQRYGHELALPVERANLRVRVEAPGRRRAMPALPARPGRPGHRVRIMGVPGQVPVYQRHELATGQVIEGPALVVEAVATLYIKPGWQATVHGAGHLRLSLG